MHLSPAVSVLLALAFSIPALAEEARVERIEVIDKGIFLIETGEQIPESTAPTGAIEPAIKFTKIEETETVPARIGVEFGLVYRIVGEPDGAEVTLEFRVNYPEDGLADPESPTPLRETKYELAKPIGEPIYFGYGFENDWELVPGSWRFEIWHAGRKLALAASSLRRISASLNERRRCRRALLVRNRDYCAVRPVERHGRDRHLRRAFLHLSRMGEIDQRVVLAVINPVDDQLLPDQRAPVVEDFLSVLAEIDIADLNRPGLPAGNRGI